jgi:glutathione S-transferase
MVKIYGSPKSSARRCYWLMEELGIQYERQLLDMQKKEHKSESFLKLNPNGKIPCIVDGPFVLWESMAITQYLADKHGKSDLVGKTVEERAQIQQWTIWSIAELQRPLVDLLIQVFFMPPEKRSQDVIDKAKKAAEPLLAILDQELKGRKYLVAERFTLADLHVASVVNINYMVRNDISHFQNVSTWMDHCMSRPAFRKVNEMP